MSRRAEMKCSNRSAAFRFVLPRMAVRHGRSRSQAAEHPSCPAFVLAAFASDEDCDVRAAASRRLETLSRHERLEALLELRALSPEKADAAALLATLLSP